MADTPQSTNDWLQAWADVQQRSWETWSNAAQQLLSASPPAAVPTDPLKFWKEGMERWWGAFAPKGENLGPQTYRRLLDQGTAFMQLSSEVLKAFQSVHAAQKAGEDWMALLGKLFEQAREALTAVSGEASEAAQGQLALWGLPLDTWRRVASSYSPFPGDMLHGFKEEDVRHVADALRVKMERFLSVPALGYTREWQEQAQEGVRYAIEYQQAAQRYSSHLGKVGLRALELFQQRIMASATAGDQSLNSLRALYGLWVDCGEQAYGEIVSSGEYQDLNAELINALMRVKHHGQMTAEEMVSAFNMPSRRELDTAHCRIHELKCEVKALKQQLKDQHVQDLDQEVQRLRHDLEALGVKQLQEDLEGLRDKVRALKSVAAPAAPKDNGSAPKSGTRSRAGSQVKGA